MSKQVLSPVVAYPLLETGRAPDGLCISGVLDYSVKSERKPPTKFPARMTVDVLDLSGREVAELPAGLTCYDLILNGNPVVTLPDDLRVESRLDLTGCDRLERLPRGLTVGSLILRGCTGLVALPEELDVWFLDLTGCWAFETWPATARIRSGQLQLRGCTALRSLPPYLNRVAALNIRECPNLEKLPAELSVSGWLDLGHSGVKDETALPRGCQGTQLRFAGINVDRRIAFHPELIEITEVLEEKNAERRRVLLDRYGFGRFLRDSNAEILDSDRDPGGQRELVRVKLVDDEDLVAMSCFCPSTQRQYMIRVPPTTPTCQHAAAWIAGFDDPADYRPLQET
jgi:hypothetical protein